MFENCIEPGALRILEKLNDCGILANGKFYLAGGTGLALQLGHRVSEDLDFFTDLLFKPQEILSQLQGKMDVTVVRIDSGTVHLMIDGQAKVSFLYYPYKLIFPPIFFKGCSLADYRDIAAMKLIAIAQRGSRKDFVDYYYLLRNRMDFSQVRDIIKNKFAGIQYSYPHLLRSIGYFEDAEVEPMPLMITSHGQRDLTVKEWNQIKAFLLAIQRNALKELHLDK